MSSLILWFQRNLGWSNSRQSWQERFGVTSLLVAAVAIAWFGRRLALAQQVVLWSILFVVLALLMRRGWLKLFGPVLFYDLLRVGRRSRYILFRCLYATFLLLLLWWVHAMWVKEYSYQYSGGVPAREMARFAESFFFTFMGVQLAVTLILTPAYLAGAIAEEKDRHTLEFLLATDLRSREIVLSKLVARVANLGLIILAGMPVLSAAQFFGGIDPDLLIASFAVLGLTMISLASVSIWMSVHSRKPRDAIVLTYLIVIIYPALALTAWAFQIAYPWLGALPLTPAALTGGVSLTIGDLVAWLNSGNLIYVIFQLGRALDRNETLADILPELLRNYALFHGLLTLLCCTWAIARLRPVALKETYGESKKAPFTVRFMGRPPIGQQPMLWKEIFAESRLRFHWLGKVAVVVLVLLSFLPLWPILLEKSRWLTEAMNVWVRIVGTGVMCLMLLAVAVRAAGSISGERDKQTLDGLLTTPMEAYTILLAKGLGSILSVRLAWLWLGTIWFFAVIAGGMHILAVPLLGAAWLIYAGVFAGAGMWFSVVCRTTLRATVWTLLAVLFLGGGHWLLSGMCCFMPLALMNTKGRDVEYLAKFQAGQTPPFVLGFFAFFNEDFNRGYRSKETTELIGFSLFGLVCWTVAALALAALVHQRFQALTCRGAGLRRERAPPRDGWTPPRRNGTVEEDRNVPVLEPVDDDESQAREDK